MLPICMVNAEAMAQVPEDVRQYLRALRRRILDLERTDPQQRIADLEAANRALQVQLDEALATIARQHEHIRHLQQQLADATAQLNTNSSNSSLPPSSDRFRRKRRPPPPADQPRKKRGGQPGHPRHVRPLVAPEHVRRSIPCKPTTCRRCGKPLTGDDPTPRRHQVAELPAVAPAVVEYQLHRLICPDCQAATCGTLPAGVVGHFGPRLEATLALLAGVYRLGLRPVVDLAADLWGLSLSTGMVSKLRARTAEALELPWVLVALHVRTRHVNIDETTWREGKHRAYLWAAVTPRAALFRITADRSARSAQALLGKGYARVATCDRLKSYWWIKRLQWCWAHLRRDFQAMVDRGRPGRAIGASLLAQSDTLFHLWHQLRDGKLTRQRLQQAMRPVRAGVHRALRRGQRSRCRKTAGTCQELLSHEEWLWTFVDVAGVHPTNNEAERAERAGVLLRKISGGTDSASGSRFIERLLTVAQTARRQGQKVLEYLRGCIEAWRHGRDPPLLVPCTI
jgi:transposase